MKQLKEMSHAELTTLQGECRELIKESNRVLKLVDRRLSKMVGGNPDLGKTMWGGGRFPTGLE